MQASFGLGILGLLALSYAQVLVWQETFDDPGATTRWTFGPTPSGVPGLITNQPGHNYFVINDANTPELDASGNFVRGRRAECGPPNNLPNPYTTSPGNPNRSLHITARASSDGAVLGYVNLPDYGDEYSWSNQGFGEDGNTDQTAFLTQNISTVGRTCLRLVADFYLGGDRDRIRSYASLLYSTNGGATWQVAVPNIQQTIPTPVWLAYHFAAGTCNNWIRLTFNLPADAENIPNLRIAFRWRNENSLPMTTADYTLSAGFNVDNIRIEAAAPPTADFTASATTVCKNQPVTFTNLTQIPCNLPTNYTWQITPATGWSFTGGTNANSVNPQVTFTANGTYTVQLTATNGAGTDVEIKTSYITVQNCPPQAAFTATPQGVCALNPTPPTGSPTQVTLTDGSNLQGQPLVSRTWSATPAAGVTFTPNNTASPVTVTFNTPGSYTITLTVTTPDGTSSTSQVINVASCACGGSAAASVDSTVFYQQTFDGCANFVFSSNGATSCGWRTQFFINGSNLCPNHWRIDANERGVTPPGCGAAGGTDKSLYMGATGGLCGWICSGACYDDGANTDKRIFLNSDINFPSGPLYPYDSIVVQFDMIAYGGGDLCGSYLDYAAFEYSTDGGATWISPNVQPTWIVAGNLQSWANTLDHMASDLCPSGQGLWTRIRWRLPAPLMTSTQFRIAFRWRNLNDGCGIDPSFAVDDVRIVGYKAVSSFTSNQYIGPNGGSWHVASHWSLNNVPDAPTEDAEIPAGKHVVVTTAVDVRHVCNFGKITVDDAPNVRINIYGNLLNEGEITSNGASASATAPDDEIRFMGSDSRYRGTGTNWDADYAVGGGKLTLEADLSCRSLRISSDFDMTNRTVTLYGNLAYTTGTITHTGSRVVLNGPCASCLFTNNIQQVNANLTLNLNDLWIDKSSGSVIQNAADVRINGQMRVIQGIYDAQTNQLRDGAAAAPLIMSGGELRLARLNTVLPQLSGTYTLTGGWITLYGGSTATDVQILRRRTNYWNLRFSGTGIKRLEGGGNTELQNLLDLSVNGYVDAVTNAGALLWVKNPALTAVSRTNGHVVGYLRRSIQGIGQYRFDVGSTAAYQRFDVLIRQPLGGVSYLSARFINQDPTDPAPAVVEGSATWQVALPPGYWEVTPDAAMTSGSYDGIAYPVGFTLPPNPAQVTLGKRPNGTPPGSADWSQTLTGTYVIPAGGIVRRNYFSAFSEFGILTSPTPLPMMKLQLTARRSAPEQATLSWEFLSPISVQKYRLYASDDAGVSWRLIHEGIDTQHSEWMPASQRRWYRVEGILANGTAAASNVAELLPYDGAVRIQVQPNPASEWVQFTLSGADSRLTVEIWDASGRRVALLVGESQVLWHIPAELPNGIYLWRAEGAGIHITGRLHIQQ
ncbi:MAG: PKD domain-containing protein [Bacteroidia bacterium]